MQFIDYFYVIKPLIPRKVQIYIRRTLAAHKRSRAKGIWPIDPKALEKPAGWTGWPLNKRFAFVLNHDVDTKRGRDNCLRLMELEKLMGFRSSFNFVPEDYFLKREMRRSLLKEGFEVGVHGLRHDGKTFKDRRTFFRRAARINYYLKEWDAVGFTSPSMLRNLGLMAELNIEHGCSSFDTDPFEPQSTGVGTIFPFYAFNSTDSKIYVELPYTLPQDHCLFVILQEKDTRIWKEKLDWISEHGGMALLNSHPDYMNFGDGHHSLEQYPAAHYVELLEYVRSKYPGQYWNALPREVARFYRNSTLPATLVRSQKSTEPAAPFKERRSINRRNRGPSKLKIWIDLDNTPHVPFFIPIMRELERRGHDILLTARDAFQVCDLAAEKRLSFTKIGHHYGKNPVKKILGLVRRSGQLYSFSRMHRPDIALSHGARSQILLGNLMRIPTILIADYEHSRYLPLAQSKWLIVPEAISAIHMSQKHSRVRYYPGIKEDVYVPDFKPDPSLLDELGLQGDKIVVTVRPPANEAHYYNPESDVLFYEFMARICRAPGVCAILLPRNRSQELTLKADHPDWFVDSKTVIPARAVDGLNLIWHSDLVVSGGGTMNREAAALGVPVYSIFRGKLGAVDAMLEAEARLTMIRSREEIWSKILIKGREKLLLPDNNPRPALAKIVYHIENIIEIELADRQR